MHVPVALLDAPFEFMRTPLPIAARRFTDIVQYSVMAKGGHFFAMEQPSLLAADINTFVAAVLRRGRVDSGARHDDSGL